MDNIKEIINCIDNYLEKSRDEYITAPDANKLLEKAGILNDSTSRHGQPLRKLLRAGKILHAFQVDVTWYIPHSKTGAKYASKRINNNLLTKHLQDNTTNHKCSFAPLIDKSSSVLILGSLPGDESLKRQEYYASPKNRFWSLMCLYANSNTPISYSQKRELLLQNRIALWDIAHSAVRSGSSDGHIQSEEPNDINGLLDKYPNITTIIFNGRKAEQLYERYFLKKENIEYYYLPSTSALNAKYSIEKLLVLLNRFTSN